MLETQVLLKYSNEDSLLLIDELGRGTSTSEGYGIAKAVCKFIYNNIKCICLFATHFHELESLKDGKKNVEMKRVSYRIGEGEVVMTHRIIDGNCKKSLGIEVAKNIGFPEAIYVRAIEKMKEKILKKLDQIFGVHVRLTINIVAKRDTKKSRTKGRKK